MTDFLILRDPTPPGRPSLPERRRLDPKIGAILFHLHDFRGIYFKARGAGNALLRIGESVGMQKIRSFPASVPPPVSSDDEPGIRAGKRPLKWRRRAPESPGTGSVRSRGARDEGSVFRFDEGHAMRGFRKRYRVAIGLLACVSLVVVSYGYWQKGALQREIAQNSGQNVQLQTRQAASGEEYLQLGRLINKVVNYGTPAQAMRSLFSEEEFTRQEMVGLMREFGAEEYEVPPEFLREVSRFIRQYQVRDRGLMAHALVDDRESLEHIKTILRRDNIPQDLAYMALVESGFLRSTASEEGAAGVWQFTEATAREYGMEVSAGVDERLDLSKSTEAASRYIRDLILDFGTGSSVMLAIAAYNSGPEKVRRAVRNVKDPIKQRNFWYLYQTHALPDETREYVPKVIAAIMIGRNPRHFGF